MQVHKFHIWELFLYKFSPLSNLINYCHSWPSFLIQLVFCQRKKKTMWFIGVEVEQETSVPPPKKKKSWIRPWSSSTCFKMVLIIGSSSQWTYSYSGAGDLATWIRGNRQAHVHVPFHFFLFFSTKFESLQ